MKLNPTYPAVLWILFVGGAPALTALLALITVPVLLTDVDAGLPLLLAPGVITVAALVVGLVAPGRVPRDVYGGALTLGLARLIVPVAMAIAWYNYFDSSAREETLPLVLLLLASAVVSLALWAWSVDYGLGVLTHLDAGQGARAVAKRVDIKPSLGRDQRKEMLKARERRGRISRAIAGTRPPTDTEPSPPPGPAIVWVEPPAEQGKGLRNDLGARLRGLRDLIGARPAATSPATELLAIDDLESDQVSSEELIPDPPSTNGVNPEVAESDEPATDDKPA